MSVLTEFRNLRRQTETTLEQHGNAKDVSDFAKYRDDPNGFFTDVLRCDMWSKQIEMAEAVRDHPRTVVVTGNGLGKDFLTARLALWWVYCCDGSVILTGPTERQVKQILMKEVRKAFSSAQELPGELLSMELRVGDVEEHGILAMTSDNADKLTGHHHPNLLICITESQGVEDECFEAAKACVVGENNRLFYYGNPTRPTGKFRDYAEKSSEWHVITVPATMHPNIVNQREEIPGAVSQAWIDSVADEFGRGSDIFKSRVLAQFPSQSTDGLLQRDWLQTAFRKHETEELSIASADKRFVLALDVARYGDDSSVLAFARGPVVEKLVAWHGADIVQTVEKVAALAEQSYNPTLVNRHRFPHLARPPIICVDGPGVGAGCVDLLKRLPPNRYGDRYKVVEYNGAAAAMNAERYLNKRAEDHWSFRDLLRASQCALPYDAMLLEEALAVEWTLTMNGGKVQIVSKDLLRKTLKRSPDRLDAVVMALSCSMGKMFGHVEQFSYSVGGGGCVITPLV
jgi:hypothetical protein